MPDELTDHRPAAVPPTASAIGVRKPHNWLQLVRFGAVGASGYVVNLAVFAACVHLLGDRLPLSAVLAFVVSVLNNFWLEPALDVRAKQDHPCTRALRFFAVSLVAFGFTYVVLVVLVGAGMHEGLCAGDRDRGRHAAVFVGQKLWSFRL